LQVAQCVPPHEAQPCPVPLTALLSPLLLLLTAANSDSARDVAPLPHCTQLIGAMAWLIGRILSNLAPHSAHTYSYIGISLPHPTHMQSAIGHTLYAIRHPPDCIF